MEIKIEDLVGAQIVVEGVLRTVREVKVYKGELRLVFNDIKISK